MRLKNWISAVAVVCLGSGSAFGQSPELSIPDRARGAQRVVVARVASQEASFESNAFGDQLTVTRAVLEVEETLKGTPVASLPFRIEGGTVGDLTLKVSDLPALSTGDRAVFFLNSTPTGFFILHRRGLGILTLDSNSRVPGANTSLSEIRDRVQSSQN